MSESSTEAVITFRLPEPAVTKLSELAMDAPRLTGSPEPSRHQVARSILLEALDGQESMTLKAISEEIKIARNVLLDMEAFEDVSESMDNTKAEGSELLIESLDFVSKIFEPSNFKNKEKEMKKEASSLTMKWINFINGNYSPETNLERYIENSKSPKTQK